MNVSDQVLENNNQGETAADVSRNGEGDQSAKVPDEGQEDYGKKQNCHPCLDIKRIGDLRERKRYICVMKIKVKCMERQTR